MARGVGGKSPSNVARYLSGIDFPARKAELIEHAKRNGAEGEVLQTLQELPEDEYQNMAEVMQGYGEARQAEDEDEGEGRAGARERPPRRATSAAGRGGPGAASLRIACSRRARRAIMATEQPREAYTSEVGAEVEQLGVLPPGLHGTDAASAVLCVLARRRGPRLGGVPARRAPRPRGRVCQSPGERGEVFDRDEFLRRVATHLNVTVLQAEAIARVVFAAVKGGAGGRVMRIAQVDPLYESVPPAATAAPNGSSPT